MSLVGEFSTSIKLKKHKVSCRCNCPWHASSMNTIAPPTFSVGHADRLLECVSISSTMIADLIKQSVLAGWREQEVALALADATDDYVVYLAQKRAFAPIVANSKGRG